MHNMCNVYKKTKKNRKLKKVTQVEHIISSCIFTELCCYQAIRCKIICCCSCLSGLQNEPLCVKLDVESCWLVSLNWLCILTTIFPGVPGLAGFIDAKEMEVVVTTGAIRRAKLQSNCHHQQTNTHWLLRRNYNCVCNGYLVFCIMTSMWRIFVTSSFKLT